MFARSLFLVDMNYGRAIMGQKRFFALPTTTEQKDVMDREKLRKKAAKGKGILFFNLKKWNNISFLH